MTARMNKPGRNDPCLCDSGKKYKKCCMDKLFSKAVEENINKQHAFLDKFKDQHTDSDITMVHADKAGIKRMSEIIIDYASELLDAATSTSDRHKAIMIAIAAWNISYLAEDEYETQINRLLNTMQINKNTKNIDEMKNVLRALIAKRQLIYPDIRRPIVNYEFTESTDGEGFDLNIMSTIETD